MVYDVIFSHIMNTLEEEKFIRAERQRKQDLYRLMLDQQVSYNNHSKYKDNTKPVRNKSFEGNYVNDEEITPHTREHQNRYFPTLADQRKSQPYEYLERRAPDLRQTSDEDRTQIYLSNCEEIIKNLRQLKVKKKQHEAQSVASVLSEPVWPQSKDNKVSAQYYPRSNYFSSQGTPYNKNLPSNSSSRYKYKDRLKTLEDSDDGSVDERNNKNSKKQFLLRKRVTGSLGNKDGTLDKYTFSNKFQEKEEEKIQLPTESDTPSGLKQHFEDSSIEQEKLTKKLHRPKFLKYTSSQREASTDALQNNTKINSQERTFKQQEKQREQNQRQQKQLSECLIELTKFLKNQNNEKKEKIVIDQDTFRPSNIHTQEISVQTSINPEKESEKNEGADKTHNFNKLKCKAIDALKQLNRQSEAFMNVASKKSGREEKQRRKESPIKAFQNVELSNQVYRSNNPHINLSETSNEQKPLALKSFKKGLSIEKQYSIRSSEDQILSENNLKQEKSNELVSLLMNQLERQGDQNEELSYCLKQLTDYLKDQNHEMQTLKTSRQMLTSQRIDKSTNRLNDSPEDLKEIYEQEEEYEVQRQEQRQLHNAVLKNLKKARMKGSVFKQKIQSFRKQHHKLGILSQKSNRPSQSVKKQNDKTVLNESEKYPETQKEPENHENKISEPFDSNQNV